MLRPWYYVDAVKLYAIMTLSYGVAGTYFCVKEPWTINCIGISASTLLPLWLLAYTLYKYRMYAWYKKTDGDEPRIQLIDLADPEEQWLATFSEESVQRLAPPSSLPDTESPCTAPVDCLGC